MIWLDTSTKFMNNFIRKQNLKLNTIILLENKIRNWIQNEDQIYNFANLNTTVYVLKNKSFFLN